MRVTIEPAAKLSPLDLPERGNIHRLRAIAVLSNLPGHIAERELKVLKRKLELDSGSLHVEEARAHGCGNVLRVEVESANVTEVFTSFGQLGVRAEIVADRLAKEVERYLEAGAPVGEHLADQLLLPMAVAGGGSFVAAPLSQHALTNIEVIRQFLPVEVKTTPSGDTAVRVEVKSAQLSPGTGKGTGS